MATGNNNGPGLVVNAQGGGQNSQTIGVIGSASNGQVQINEIANERLTAEAETAIKLLEEIKSSVKSPKPDKASITSKLADLAQTHVAPVVKSVIETLVKNAIERRWPSAIAE